jgi:glucose-1-phosphate thymidylyltransferase
MKGIILAGGSGTRLYPLTMAVSKQLLPVYNKPMIYYPLSALMFAGIRDILVITTPHEAPLFRNLLGAGEELGLRFQYAVQPRPNGLPEAFIIGRDFIGDDSVCLVLGDNIFYGDRLPTILKKAREELDGCVLFGYRVRSPERYGVVEYDDALNILSIEEKPARPKSRVAVTGLYFYDHEVVDIAAGLKPSARGELEITDLNNDYVSRGKARLQLMGRGMAWLDTGTFESLLEANQFVQVLERRQGTRIACLEEISFRMGYIDKQALLQHAEKHRDNEYGRYLTEVAEEG